MRALATELERPFSRGQERGHFTGSAVVVDPAGERVVMVHHGKLKRWLQPGGHAEEGDGGSMEATALREAREETGCRVRLHASAPRPLDVDIHTIPARKDEPEHVHLDVRYLVVAEDPEALAHDPGESSGAQWLTLGRGAGAGGRGARCGACWRRRGRRRARTHRHSCPLLHPRCEWAGRRPGV